MRKYFRDVGIIAFAETLLQFRYLFLTPFITRRFGALDYGVWSQIAVLAVTLAPLVTLGTAQGALRYMPGLERSKQKRYLSAWILFLLGTGLLTSLPLLLFPRAISEALFGSSEGYIAFLPLAAISLILNQMVNVVKNWFKVINNAVLFSATNIGRELLQVVAAVVMLTQGKGVYELIVYSLISDAVVVVLALGINFRIYGIGKPDFSLLPEMIKFGLPLIPLAFSSWGLNYLDRFFLVQVSLEAVGVYSLAYSLSGQVIPIMLRPFWSMFPSTAAGFYNKGRREALQSLYDRSAGLAFMLTVPASVGLALIAQRLILLFSTSEFVGGAPIVFFVSLGAMMNNFASFYAVTLGLVHKQHLSLVANIIAFIINALLNVLLIPKLGILGAAIATFVAFAVLLALLVLFSEQLKIVTTNFRFPLKVIGATSLMAAIVILADHFWVAGIGNKFLEIAILTMLGATSYALSLFALKAIRQTDFALVRSFFSPTPKSTRTKDD